ncbi:MAG: hypothetical protein HYZ28_02925 [Myxococcales bacterium]|nr:hypothetical protein [Myxococcales bacterium]
MNAVSLVLTAALSSSPAEAWSDSKAELSSYRLVQPRYGQPRQGHAVMVWVAEPFSPSKLVKPDLPGKDALTVMKLNFIRRFRTGIYDYSLMTSVFAPFGSAAPLGAGRPLKVTFSSQDWCGQVFHQLEPRGDGLHGHWRSYFESEASGSEVVPLTEDSVLEDELWHRLRGLTRELEPGKYRLVPSAQAVRMSHAPMVPGELEVRRAAAPPVTVPAGTFEVVRWDLSLRWGRDGRQAQKRTVWTERAAPHRIVAWEGEVPGFRGNEPAKERGELLASIRDAYWEHHGLEHEPLRGRLRLP